MRAHSTAGRHRRRATMHMRPARLSLPASVLFSQRSKPKRVEVGRLRESGEGGAMRRGHDDDGHRRTQPGPLGEVVYFNRCIGRRH
ncbi:hypothetical protein EYF80_057547 [Liparis tanakae]|uniref:Uncharacterized protein n=1 Tax=Liparis tanakae TaxID=230148 RepID=A0A4Z2EVA7_9TELE|nr:hypothetical protein EYF80_057547 [Liparis tanakae]